MIVAVFAADGIGAVDIAIGMTITFDAGFFIVAFEVGILHSCFLCGAMLRAIARLISLRAN
jgi:hypothetical protein